MKPLTTTPGPLREPTRTSDTIWPTALALSGATLLAQLTSLAYGRVDESQPFLSIVGPSVLVLVVVTLPLCWLGLRLGRSIGMGQLIGPGSMVSANPKSPQVRRSVALVVILSLALAAVLLLLRQHMAPFQPAELPALGHRGVIGGLAVSCGAAVAEEIWFRLGLMTLLVWFVTRLIGAREARPGVVWPIIVIAAVGFGLAHLPQLVSYGAHSPLAITGTIFGNTAVGILYGWSYWRHGLIVAMLSHFVVDLVLHVLPALI